MVEGSAKDCEIGIAERLKIGLVPDREPGIGNQQGKQDDPGGGLDAAAIASLIDRVFIG